MTDRLTYPALDDDRTLLTCSQCGQAARVELHGDQIDVRCYAGCSPEESLAGIDNGYLLAELQDTASRAGRTGSLDASEHPEGVAHAIPLSAVVRERVEWLVHGRVPLGGLSLLIGDPGLGKSLWTCGVAAEVSRRGRDALLVTAEDSLAATVRPRLEAVGADLDRVHAVEVRREGVDEGIRLPDDVGKLETLVAHYGAQLVVIDPLMAHLPENVNSWRDQSVRRALAPLHRLAETRGCAVIVVGHLNKAQGTDPLYRAGGSIGIGGAARSMLLLARDPEDPEGDKGVQRVLAHVKCNVAPLAASLAYRVEPTLLDEGDERIETVRLVAHGEIEATGAQLLTKRDEEDAPARTEAEEFLSSLLSDGPVEAKRVVREAVEAGISKRTLDRAKGKLGVTSRQAEGAQHSGWVWVLPDRGNLTADGGNLTAAEPNPLSQIVAI